MTIVLSYAFTQTEGSLSSRAALYTSTTAVNIPWPIQLHYMRHSHESSIVTLQVVVVRVRCHCVTMK